MKSTRPVWTCRGDVRGSCRVRHRSYAASMACIERDMLAVKKKYGRSAYSDRWPTAANEAAADLLEESHAELDYYICE